MAEQLNFLFILFSCRMKHIVRVSETIDAHANNEDQNDEYKDNSIGAKLDEETHLSNQSQAHKHHHDYDAGVRVREFIEINICRDRFILTQDCHNDGIEVLSKELEVQYDWNHQLSDYNCHARHPSLPSELFL